MPTGLSGLRAAQSATAVRAVSVDDLIVTVGAGDVDERGSFYGLVTVEGDDRPVRSEAVDVDAAGSPIPNGNVAGLLVLPDEWIVVGSTTLTDPGHSGDESFLDNGIVGFPSDVALWSSIDEGDSWEQLDVAQFGVFTLDVLTSTDGRSWELHPYRRPTEPSAGDLAKTRGLSFVEGAIVVIDEIIDGIDPSLVMSVIDPATDEIVSHDSPSNWAASTRSRTSSSSMAWPSVLGAWNVA